MANGKGQKLRGGRPYLRLSRASSALPVLARSFNLRGRPNLAAGFSAEFSERDGCGIFHEAPPKKEWAALRGRHRVGSRTLRTARSRTARSLVDFVLGSEAIFAGAIYIVVILFFAIRVIVILGIASGVVKVLRYKLQLRLRRFDVFCKDGYLPAAHRDFKEPFIALRVGRFFTLSILNRVANVDSLFAFGARSAKLCLNRHFIICYGMPFLPAFDGLIIPEVVRVCQEKSSAKSPMFMRVR